MFFKKVPPTLAEKCLANNEKISSPFWRLNRGHNSLNLQPFQPSPTQAPLRLFAAIGITAPESNVTPLKPTVFSEFFCGFLRYTPVVLEYV